MVLPAGDVQGDRVLAGVSPDGGQGDGESDLGKCSWASFTAQLGASSWERLDGRRGRRVFASSTGSSQTTTTPWFEMSPERRATRLPVSATLLLLR